MSIETEFHEFIGWHDGYHQRDAEVDELKAEIEWLRKLLSIAVTDATELADGIRAALTPYHLEKAKTARTDGCDDKI